MKYTDMTDYELLVEIHRVQDLVMFAKNPHTKKQNAAYLKKLNLERRKRKDAPTNKHI